MHYPAKSVPQTPVTRRNIGRHGVSIRHYFREIVRNNPWITDLTVYLGARLWAGAEAWAHPEIGQGFGLDNTLGLARTPWMRRIDVAIGTFFSNLVMFFIILTTALTLHRHGVTAIATTKDAAEALRPLAGDRAYLLYTLGIIGTGLLAIPTLAGSAAYAFAETFDWAYGLDEKFENAVSFYVLFITATAVGAMLDLLKIDPIKALLWSAIVNGVLAPFLLVGILVVASEKVIMRGQASSPVARIVVALTTILMFAAGIGMFIF